MAVSGVNSEDVFEPFSNGIARARAGLPRARKTRRSRGSTSNGDEETNDMHFEQGAPAIAPDAHQQYHVI
jgi:hypothetical protein